MKCAGNGMEYQKMLEFLSEIHCIGEDCRTISYWIGSAVGSIIIFLVLPASILLFLRKKWRKWKKNKTSNQN